MRLQPLYGGVWAQNVLTKISNSQAVLRSRQVGAILRALVQDASQLGSYSSSECTDLLQIIAQIETRLLSNGEESLAGAIARVVDTQTALTGDTPWKRFSEEQSFSLQRILSIFREKNPEIPPSAMINVAEQLSNHADDKDKRYGTAWTLAKLASEYPDTKTQEQAKEVLDRFEGKRRSPGYVISELCNHGGTSMAIDLVSLIPAVGFTRVAWLAKKSLWLRTLAAGGIHWGFTKGIKLATGYTGNILPNSPKEFLKEFASSTLEASAALFLSYRGWMWGHPLVKETEAGLEAVATVEKSTLTMGDKLWNGIGKGYSAVGWATKNFVLKAGVGIGGSNLLAQIGMHQLGLKDMTPQGLPSRLLWSEIRDTRLAVAQTYEARRLFLQSKVDDQADNAKTIDLKNFLTKLEPQLDPKKDKIKYDRVWNILVKAAAAGHLNLGIQRWILNKNSQGDLPGVNQTFKREDIDIPLRLEKEKSDVSLCIPDSEDFPCRNPPQTP